ncbi:hypothetical protein [Desulfopila sp. IMCC35008]|uniref:hypothetical protein n=1 Tax=Desulfopila sp. IMCC35008 TaxID=2653858 RepID=UPI0013D2EA14|nr:hypothetical protein [Desulfopila sp. IMCC35008]
MVDSLHSLRDELRKIVGEAEGDGSEVVEKYLEKRLGSMSSQEKISCLDELSSIIDDRSSAVTPGAVQHSGGELTRFTRLILGDSATSKSLDEQLLEERLSNALTDIFNGINRLLRAIDSTLGREIPLDRTIRSMVGGQLDDETQRPLSEVIDRVRHAFLLSYESGKESHAAVMEKVLSELAPDRILEDCAGSLKIGPLRKADAFERYSQVYASLKEWHTSGRGIAEYLERFEGVCNRATRQHEEGKS